MDRGQESRLINRPFMVLSAPFRRIMMDWPGKKPRAAGTLWRFFPLPFTQSADLPVRPFEVEPAEPALATGAPPDAPAAAPARSLLALAAVALLGAAVPAAAAHEPGKHHHGPCPAKQAQVAKQVQRKVVAQASKPAPRATITPRASGGGLGHWPQIAADLMP